MSDRSIHITIRQTHEEDVRQNEGLETPQKLAKRPENEPGTRTKRVKHRKTRTGCSTCSGDIRARRVKCDEAKPACNRCIKSEWDCGGYREESKVSGSKARYQRRICRDLVPKTADRGSYREETKALNFLGNNQGRKLIPKPAEPSPELYAAAVYISPMFLDGTQYRYFRYYLEEVATQFPGPNSTSLWERLVPQAGKAESFIAQTVIAIGALSMSKKAPFNAKDVHHQYALVQYGKALRAMRLGLKNQAQDKRNALIACLLVFIFECLLGRPAAASQYAFSGLDLLYSGESDGPVSSTNFEDDLGAALSSLDVQSMRYVNRRALYHQRLRDRLNKSLLHIPKKLTTLKECGTYLNMMVRRNLHFLAVSTSEGTVSEDSSQLDGSRTEIVTWTDRSDDQLKPSALLALAEERDQYLEDLRCWELSSALVRSQTYTEIKDRMVACVLELTVKTNIILLSRAACEAQPPELVYDKFLPEFKTIVRLAGAIYELLLLCDRKFQTASFRCDSGVVMGLAVTGSHCRDKVVRSQAIDALLIAEGYREGCWDAIAEGTYCNYVRNIEEEFRDETGLIPGNKRVESLRKDMNLLERKVDITLKQWIGDGHKSFIIREATLSW